MKISIIGPMACGKTTIGRRLANQLNLPFYDTDHLIEQKAGHTVSEIFATLGESRFRILETGILKKLLYTSGEMVIATGGGIIKNPENRRLLNTCSQVLFLDISVTEQMKRTEGDTTRPLLTGTDKEKTLISLRRERESLYREIAHQTIQVDRLSHEAIMNLICFFTSR